MFLSSREKYIPGIMLSACDRWYQPFLTILPLQILANAMAEQKGIKAGDFRWGNKVTRVE